MNVFEFRTPVYTRFGVGLSPWPNPVALGDWAAVGTPGMPQ